jgi:hypothetical protein
LGERDRIFAFAAAEIEDIVAWHDLQDVDCEDGGSIDERMSEDAFGGFAGSWDGCGI